MVKLPLFVIVGPTASGKTEISLGLAKEINGEIINADSRQIFKEVSIGTAKPRCDNPLDEYFSVKEIRHYGINVASISFGDFSAGAFMKLFDNAVTEIYNNGKIPILSGGTGLYINAVLHGLADIPEIPEDIKKIAHEMAENDINKAYKKLAEVDPITANVIDKHNPRRIARALEVYLATSKPISYWHSKVNKKNNFDINMFGLLWEKEELNNRIELRVQNMIDRGFIKEVEVLLERGYSEEQIKRAGIGYSYILDFINGIIPEKDLIELITIETKQYAKRQMTYFRRDENIRWINMTNDISIDDVVKIMVE
jgi:tRNA dimethylallyltransferase